MIRKTLMAVAALALMAAPAAADCGSCGNEAHAKDHAEGKAHAHAHATVGEAAPDFTLVDHAGNEHSLSDYEGKTVVLEWTNPTCPFVVRHYKADTMTNLAEANSDVVWLAIDSSNFVTAEAAAEWAEKEGINYPILLDANGKVGRMYEAKTTPHMFVINGEGTLVYNGAIDSDPRGNAEGEVTNYVATALKSVKAGKAVETASTKPYGCSVKYMEKKDAKAASSSR